MNKSTLDSSVWCLNDSVQLKLEVPSPQVVLHYGCHVEFYCIHTISLQWLFSTSKSLGILAPSFLSDIHHVAESNHSVNCVCLWIYHYISGAKYIRRKMNLNRFCKRNHKDDRNEFLLHKNWHGSLLQNQNLKWLDLHISCLHSIISATDISKHGNPKSKSNWWWRAKAHWLAVNFYWAG